jgi:hypothetical protein
MDLGEILQLLIRQFDAGLLTSFQISVFRFYHHQTENRQDMPRFNSCDHASTRPLAALLGGVSIALMKFFITGGTQVALFEFHHQPFFLQRTALTGFLFGHNFTSFAFSDERPIDWDIQSTHCLKSAALVRRIVTGIVNVALIIHDVTAAKIGVTLIIRFTHPASGLAFVGFVHGVTSLIKYIQPMFKRSGHWPRGIF